MMEIVLVAAVADNGVIGNGNKMPWRLRSDLQRFRALTWGKPVVMGRKTFLSIGKPLAGRTNIVVSRDPAFSAAGAVVASSLDIALEVAGADVLRRGIAEAIVAGGGEIYSALLPRSGRLEITRVHATPEGDAHFPPIDPTLWVETESTPPGSGPDDTAMTSFHTYRRRKETA